MRLVSWVWAVWGLLSLGVLPVDRTVAYDIPWPRVLAGEVVVETIPHPEGAPGIRGTFVVSAPRERIWNTLVDYDRFTTIYKGIEKIRVLELTPAGAQLEFWVDAVFKKLHYVLSRRYDEPGRRISWRRLTGDLKRLDGSWEIRDTPQAGSYLLVYESFVEIVGGPPVKLMRWMAMERTRDMGERVRNWIEGRPLPE